MGWKKQIEDRERLHMLLRAVGSHPWARIELLQSQSGLRLGEFEAAVKLATRYRLVARAEVRTLGQSPARYALTAAGADRIHAACARPWQQKALLAALKLDYARSLLNAWFETPGVVWALSPYLVPARMLRPVHQGTDRSPNYAHLAYRSLWLDALACLRLAPSEYFNVALLTDPGYLKLDWLYQQFRSAHAWRRRSEFLRPGNSYFPVFVVITTDAHRLTQLAQLWRETTPDGDWPGPLRLTTLSGLDRSEWWNETRQATHLWGDVVTSARPSLRPAVAYTGWWGEAAPDEVAANQPVANRPAAAPAAKPASPHVAQTIGLGPKEVRHLLEVHQAISLKARELLDRVGQYPMISTEDLAVVMTYTPRHIRASLQELKALGLVETLPPRQGYVVTWSGLCLLAAQIGLAPVEYARLRGWPLRQARDGVAYATAWLESAHEHTALVIDFLVGLCRHGPPRLSLVRWDHVQCLYDLPPRAPAEPSASLTRLRAVSPDASGVVRFGQAGGAASELAFWLEVDRASAHGQFLADKLARYYRLGGAWDGLVGFLPRLLILVERGGEGRLQSLRRRLQALNHQYRTRLDVRLSRADLLADEHGRLNPVKPVWRTVESSAFVSAFEE